jgi:hypothetical protein
MGFIQSIEKFLQGKKAYIVMLSGVVAALLGVINGDLTMVQAISAIWASAGLGAMRSAVSKSGPSN